jgi:hypothetical protein
MKKNLRIDGHGKEAEGGGFNAGLLLGYDFGLLALQGEVLFNTGWNGYNYYEGGYGGGDEHFGFDLTTLQIPVMLKLDLHWRRIMFQPQLGFYLNFGLGGMRYNYNAWHINRGQRPYEEGSIDYSSPLFGFMAGGAFGVRIGRGYLFMDIRYATDLGNIKVIGIEMKRHAVMSALGYQYYFRSKQ